MLLLVSLFLVHVALVLASFEVGRVQSRRRAKMGKKGFGVQINHRFFVFSFPSPLRFSHLMLAMHIYMQGERW
jgi:hypothetical protein